MEFKGVLERRQGELTCEPAFGLICINEEKLRWSRGLCSPRYPHVLVGWILKLEFKRRGHFLEREAVKASPVAQLLKKSACQSRRLKRCGFDPWVGKIPWSRKWQPVFLPGKLHGQRSLVGCSSWDHKESDMTERLSMHACWVTQVKEIDGYVKIPRPAMERFLESMWVRGPGQGRGCAVVREDCGQLEGIDSATQSRYGRCWEQSAWLMLECEGIIPWSCESGWELVSQMLGRS